MPRKYFTSVFTLVLVFSLLVLPSFAAEFQLTSIGALETGGSRYSDWWYTGSRPVLSGTGDSEVEITVKVDDDSNNVRSDSNGNWEYALDKEAGDYEIEIVHGNNNSYAFTLHLGQGLPADLGGVETTQSTTAVPETGFNQILGVSLGIGVLLLGFYFYIWGDPKKRVAFEKRFLRD